MRMSLTSMLARVRSWRGEKQRTRQRPLSPSATSRPRSASSTEKWGESGLRAAKSLVKTKVEVYWGVVDAAGTLVAGAEITGGVVLEGSGGRGCFGLALPGAISALRADEDPFALERIVAAMRVFGGEGVHWAVSFGAACFWACFWARAMAPSVGSVTKQSASMPVSCL